MKTHKARKNYEMTQADLDVLLKASRPVSAIALHCGPLGSVRESVNDAWKALGEKMGFDHMTARPSGRGDRFFTAIPK